MLVASSNDELYSEDKLTSEEISYLREELSNALGDVNKEDASDLLEYLLAMISNGKNVKYIVEELISMDMKEVCDETMAGLLGELIGVFLKSKIKELKEAKADHTRVVSLKASNAAGNALAKSGALGSYRSDKLRKRYQNIPADMKSSNHKTASKESEKTLSNKPTKHRSLASAAFGRLIKQNQMDIDTEKEPVKQHQGRGRVRGRGRGRGDSSPTRPGNRVHGGRGDKRGHGGRNKSGRGQMERKEGNARSINENKKWERSSKKASHADGQRRKQHEQEEDFISTGTGGPRNGSSSNAKFGSKKRMKLDKNNQNEKNLTSPNHSDVIQTASQTDANDHMDSSGDQTGATQDHHTSYSYWRGGGGRGRERGRGRGFFPGRHYQRGTPVSNAAPHPSPLIAASFAVASTFGDSQSYRGRGRGRFGRAPIPGRAVVEDMLSAKTWVRKRTMDESLACKR